MKYERSRNESIQHAPKNQEKREMLTNFPSCMQEVRRGTTKLVFNSSDFESSSNCLLNLGHRFGSLGVVLSEEVSLIPLPKYFTLIHYSNAHRIRV